MSMSLTCGLTFTLNDDFEAEVERVAALALLDLAEDAVQEMKTRPETPRDTLALEDSLRVAPPGYAQDDTPLVSRSPLQNTGRSFNLGPRSADRGGAALTAAVAAIGGNASSFGGDVGTLVEFTATGLHTWVGSWVYYAYWVHQGYYNVLAQRPIAGRAYVVDVAQPKLQDYADYFRRRWVARTVRVA